MAYRKLVSQEQELLSPQLAQAVRAFHQNTGHQWDDADQHQLQLWHFSTRKYSAVTGAAPLSKSKALSSLLLSRTCARERQNSLSTELYLLPHRENKAIRQEHI